MVCTSVSDSQRRVQRACWLVIFLPSHSMESY
jgi:hypothetical protein